MLIKIQGEHCGSIVMFSTIAVQLLKMMGQSGNTEGAIKSSEIPAAFAQLELSLENHVETDQQSSGDDYDDTPSISLKTRAVPLLDLLEKNATSGGYVMWQPQ